MLVAVCGRYTNTAGRKSSTTASACRSPAPTGTGRYNIAPTEEVLAIVAPKGEPEAELMRWGLVPSWATELKGGR